MLYYPILLCSADHKSALAPRNNIAVARSIHVSATALLNFGDYGRAQSIGLNCKSRLELRQQRNGKQLLFFRRTAELTGSFSYTHNISVLEMDVLASKNIALGRCFCLSSIGTAYSISIILCRQIVQIIALPTRRTICIPTLIYRLLRIRTNWPLPQQLIVQSVIVPFCGDDLIRRCALLRPLHQCQHDIVLWILKTGYRMDCTKRVQCSGLISTSEVPRCVHVRGVERQCCIPGTGKWR